MTPRLFCIITIILSLQGFINGASRPNIVFVFSDDHATQALGAYGFEITKFAPTPYLDALARQGMRFDRCMVTNSICGPSRAVILTGKYSHLNGFGTNDDAVFNGSQVTFPKLLQNAGYETAIIGKWHLFSEPTGFNHWEVLPNQGRYYRPEFITPKGEHVEEGYCTEVITDKAIDWLNKNRNSKQPFMLMVQHKAPHREWSPDTKYLDLYEDLTMPEPETLFDNYKNRGTAAREQDMSIEHSLEEDRDLKISGNVIGRDFYEQVYIHLTPEQKKSWDKVIARRTKEFSVLEGKALVRWKYQQYIKDYMRCIRSVDDSVGRIQKTLEDLGLDKNTVFIYSSDQGFFLGEHGWFDKRFMYDESYRTPLLIKWPGVVEPNSSSRELVSNLDFAQTFLDMAGVEADTNMQGKSLLPLLKGDKNQHRDFHYYHYSEYPGWHMVKRHEGVYDGRYKLIYFYDIKEWELYDLVKDPQEMKNEVMSPEYSSVLANMQENLTKARMQYKVPEGYPAPRAIENPDVYYSKQRTKKTR